ncbi:MAG: Stp1/IreP family PP2C-type Ser/Thr phosphatase [Actinobacteria bacterium]|nr:MAG: Stp1/IreP family PP2C-type Ser/Thr phosphatase [Actinomycetota bacterium]
MLRVADSFARTDTGRQRRSNEDAFYARPPLFAVADGMGGARAGEVASSLLVEVLESGLPDGGNDEERVAGRVREANAQIHELSRQDAERAGMGTTVTAAYVGDRAVALAHVGDSRAYRLHDGRLEQMTRDHSLVEELKRRGKLTEEEAEEHPQRSVITRALGPEARVDVDTVSVPAQAGDVFLLCSDGLTAMVPEERIEEIFGDGDGAGLERVGRELIAEANDRGGRDNITVVLFSLEDVADGAVTDQPTQIGVPAPSAEQVEAAKATAEAESAAAPRRTVPLPRRRKPAAPAAARGRRRRIRGLVPTLIVVAILGALAAGAWVATRAVYFVGTTHDGFVAVYRGLPWNGPFGVHLYESFYVSAVPVSEVPTGRRHKLLDHQLRSQGDASDLVRKIEQGQVGAS